MKNNVFCFLGIVLLLIFGTSVILLAPPHNECNNKIEYFTMKKYRKKRV
jgi:hypothetical protein